MLTESKFIPVVDTIILTLRKDDYRGCSFLETIPPVLNNDSIIYQNIRGCDKVVGKLKNLHISVTDYEFKINGGSLCKYWLGDNFNSMGLADIKRAFENLSDEFKLPLERAEIKKIDLAQNLILKHPVNSYYYHLGALNGFSRGIYGESLYYWKNGNRRKNNGLCFYDKIKESKQKKSIIPNCYNGCNVLRYERRLTGKFGIDRFLVRNLCEESNYINLVNRWGDDYRLINKYNKQAINLNSMRTKKDLYKLGVIALIQQMGGQGAMLDYIKQAQITGQLDKVQAHHIRNVIKSINDGLNISGGEERDELINELDRKINDAVAFYR